MFEGLLLPGAALGCVLVACMIRLKQIHRQSRLYN